MTLPILTVKALKKYFPYKKDLFVKAVDGVDFEIFPGETLGLVGESGSGKSTVAYTIVGMYAPTQGDIYYNDEDISMLSKNRSHEMKGNIQIVFQDPGSSLNPQRSVGKTLSFPLRLHRSNRKSGFPTTPGELLDSVGLPEENLYRFPRMMSGGERQLVAIARALATGPNVMILDEPTSALDVSVQAKVINRLLTLQNKFNLSYLFITHDLSLMRNVAHRVAIMYLGKICEIATIKEFFERPLHPYTKMLLSSIPVATDEEEALKPDTVPSSGEIPSPVNIPTGCSFHLRCPMKMDICTQRDPETISIAPDHKVRCHLFSGAS